MNNKQILKKKVVYLESSLMESESVIQGLLTEVERQQKAIESYKESEDPKDLEQNNDMVLDLIKLRLDKGARDYHRQIPIMPIDDLNRDNFYEAVEEALDLSVYLAAYMLRLMEEKERREFEPTTADEHNKEIHPDHGPAYSMANNSGYEKEKKDDKTKRSTT
ncbi:hypothetical protein CL614_06985 [archaeon]|jgi:hypothetical protein|nr:hypothetical protein [archaeon]|tara:strand:- start:623 stop:1111 length:489 start_codon:yes stop_codon:yes gene_type:complete